MSPSTTRRIATGDTRLLQDGQTTDSYLPSVTDLRITQGRQYNKTQTNYNYFKHYNNGKFKKGIRTY